MLMTDRLDVSSLRNASGQLDQSIGYLESDLARSDRGLRQQFRAAAIQAFEFTHELGFKLLKRQLERMSPDPTAVDKMTYMEIIRSGAEAGLVLDVARSRTYREQRNIASHTYDEANAEAVVTILHDFASDTRHLLSELERRNA